MPLQTDFHNQVKDSKQRALLIIAVSMFGVAGYVVFLMLSYTPPQVIRGGGAPAPTDSSVTPSVSDPASARSSAAGAATEGGINLDSNP